MRSTFLHLLSALLCSSTVLLCACSKAEYRQAAGAAWGTTYNITYKATADLNDSIIYMINKVDNSLSPFEKGSIVSRVNANEPVKADKMLADVIRLSQRVWAISDGAFDPTVAPIVNLWGFGYHEGAEVSPSVEEIDSVLGYIGIMDCGVTADSLVYKKSPKTEFNFSGIAKGYGVDAIASMLRRNGCNDYMVEIGGEIALSGLNPNGDNWHIQIDAPIVDESRFMHHRLTVLDLTDRCIATSGNYRNFRVVGDSLVGHIIHPATGMPLRTTTLSVTVLAPSTALADALATASMAMTPDDAAKMLVSVPLVEAIIVSSSSESEYVVSTIPPNASFSGKVSGEAKKR